ncbi:tRNA (guanine-N(7)-)-methyltransferase non-catalytic subunit wuho isoform X1 [Hydra vulgaris]|nr:tRNA (guanine-N(7)-)-methyltransferase non-catalytic subunit wuho [Hydra vulgaris]
MSVFISSNRKSLLAISVKNSLKIIELEKNEAILSYVNQLTSVKEEQNEVDIIAHKFSPDSCYFAAITGNKKLFVWKMADKNVCCTMDIGKRPTCLSFEHDKNTVVVGDKSGDVYQCALEETKPKLLLGHLSMVLDVILTPDCSFIISADRDEKIRVSSYPMSFCIHSFCLGHTGMVSCISLISTDRLVSVSSDLTLRLWDFKKGIQLSESVQLPKDCIVSHLEVCSNEIAIMAERLTELRIYRVDNDLIRFHSVIKLHSTLLSFTYVAENNIAVVLKDSSRPFVMLRLVEDVYTEVNHELCLAISSHIGMDFSLLPEPSTLIQLLKPVNGKRSFQAITPEATINIESSSISNYSKKTKTAVK